MTLAKNALNGAAVTMGGQLLKFALQAFLMVSLARMLTPDSFGLVAMVMAIAGVALVLSDFGLSMAYIQAEEVDQQQRSNLFWINVFIGLLFTSLIYFSAPLIAKFYEHKELKEIAEVISCVFLLNACATQHRADATKRLLFKQLVLVDILSSLFATAVAFYLGSIGYQYWALVGYQVVLASCTLVFSLCLIRWIPSRPRNLRNILSFVKYGKDTVLVQLLNYFTSNVDSVVIGKRSGAIELGLYDRAFQLFKIPLNQIAAPLTRVAVSVLSKVNGTKKFNEYLLNGQLAMALVLGGGFAFVVVNATSIVSITLGEGWTGADRILTILAIGGLFQSLSYPYFWAFLSKAQTGLQLKFAVFTKIISICLIVLGSVWGSIGVAAGVVLGNALNWLVLTSYAMPRLGLSSVDLYRNSGLALLVVAIPLLGSFLWLNCYSLSYSHYYKMGVTFLVFVVFYTLSLCVSRKFRFLIKKAVLKHIQGIQ